MINKKYLEQALRIRKDFKSTDGELSNIQTKLKEINDQLEKTLEELKIIKSNTENYTTNESFQSDVMEHLKEFEVQSEKANSIYVPLNEKMEKLKVEESDLYNTLLKEYSSLDEEKIIHEIREYVMKHI